MGEVEKKTDWVNVLGMKNRTSKRTVEGEGEGRGKEKRRGKRGRSWHPLRKRKNEREEMKGSRKGRWKEDERKM